MQQHNDTASTSLMDKQEVRDKRKIMAGATFSLNLH